MASGGGKWRVNRDGPAWLMDQDQRIIGYVDARGKRYALPQASLDEQSIQGMQDPAPFSFAADTFSRSQAAAASLTGSPVGANSYELIYQHVMSGNYSYANVISYLVAARVKLVRVLFPVYSANEFLGNCFNGLVPEREFTDADFRQPFLTRADEVLAACATAKLKLLVCLFWEQTEIATLNGETLVQAIKTTSRTYAFMQRFLRWFGARYGAHPALGAYSFSNEPNYDPAGITNPTPADLGAVTTGLVTTLRTYAPAAIATTELSFLPLQELASRPTFESEAANLRVICAGVDAVGLHVYGARPTGGAFSFVGSTGEQNAAFAPAPTNDLGYEGLPSFLSAAKSLAGSMGLPLWITETGVPTDLEDAAKSVRRQRLVKTCATYAQMTLLWNVADLAGPQAGQVAWQIRPGTALGNAMLPIFAAANTGPVVQNREVGGGTRALSVKNRPTFCFSSVRSANATVRVTSTAAMLSSTQAVMFWVRRDAALNQFEGLMDLRGAGQKSGFNLLAGNAPATDADFVDWRGAADSIVNTAGALPRDADATWVHYAYVYRTINGQIGIELWRDGLFWRMVVPGSAYAGIPNATTLYFVGNSVNGAPVSLQDVCLAPYATPDDIWAHMAGAVLPQATLHLRANSVGIFDLGPSRVAVTVGAGALFGVA